MLLSECSPGMAAAHGPAAPSSPEQVSHLLKGRDPLAGARQAGRLGWGWGEGLSRLCQGGAGTASELDRHQPK